MNDHITPVLFAVASLQTCDVCEDREPDRLWAHVFGLPDWPRFVDSLAAAGAAGVMGNTRTDLGWPYSQGLSVVADVEGMCVHPADIAADGQRLTAAESSCLDPAIRGGEGPDAVVLLLTQLNVVIPAHPTLNDRTSPVSEELFTLEIATITARLITANTARTVHSSRWQVTTRTTTPEGTRTNLQRLPQHETRNAAEPLYRFIGVDPGSPHQP